MSNINNNLQTQTSNALHNAIMEAGGKDCPLMLAPANYVQWKSRIKRYIDTKPNHELIYYCLENPPYEYTWIPNPTPDTPATLGTDGGIDNDIYSTVDACPNSKEMWKAIEQLKQAESINVQDLKTTATKNRGKEIANSPLPTYDPEPEEVADDEASLKEKEIDKIMALISMSFNKIYKPTNNNLKTSSNTKNTNVDNTPRTNQETGQHPEQLESIDDTYGMEQDERNTSRFINIICDIKARLIRIMTRKRTLFYTGFPIEKLKSGN
ncbi:hypothetical protein Tco_0222458 [Tanacetum coccineum]